MFQSAGYEILDYGFTKTPKEQLSLIIITIMSQKIYLLSVEKRKNPSLNFPKNKIPNSINNFTYELKIKYANLMLKKISFTLFKSSMRYFRTFALFFIYGLIDFISLKIFRISFVSKFLRKA